MAKEDILLREEMGRLEIEPIKIKRHRSDENPFSSHSKQGLMKIVSIQNASCSCNSQKKNSNSGICKKKRNKILKEPVLQILKSYVGNNTVRSEECQHETSSFVNQNVNIDTLNLRTLVKNCNQLKISCSSNDLTTGKNENDKTKWWKNEVVSVRESREPKYSNQAGTCSQQALNPPCDITIDELASYFETLVHIPKKMSSMAEMMYI